MVIIYRYLYSITVHRGGLTFLLTDRIQKIKSTACHKELEKFWACFFSILSQKDIQLNFFSFKKWVQKLVLNHENLLQGLQKNVVGLMTSTKMGKTGPQISEISLLDESFAYL